MTEFVSGIELNASFYAEAVAPLLRDTTHSAGLLGWGSDVLGFDTARSTDHGWGPRLIVFVASDDVDAAQRVVDDGLPDFFMGWPVRYGWDEVAPSHHVTVTTVRDWLLARLGVDATQPLANVDWLVMPQQLVLGVVRGAMYHDGLGTLGAVRDQLGWYSDELWRWLVACQWRKLSQEEPFVGRTAEVGDDIGSRLVAARQVREVMRLHFLLERTYAPYTKWFGTAYERLSCAPAMQPLLRGSVDGDENALVALYEATGVLHNATHVTEPVDTTVRQFHNRPFRVLGADRFVDTCLATLTDDWLRRQPLIGSVDQWADSTDVIAYPATLQRLRAAYAP